MRKRYVIPVFIPHLACPGRCSFCDQKAVTGVQSPPPPSEVKALIEGWFARIPPKVDARRIQISFFGGSLTLLPERLQRAYLEVAFQFVEEGKVGSLRLSTRPDAIDEGTLSLLTSYGVKTVEIGVQSFEENVLRENLRGHGAKETIRAIRLVKARGLELVLQLMAGLPKQTPEVFSKDVEKAIYWMPNAVRIYPTVVLERTLLCEWMEKGLYRPLLPIDAVEQVAPAVVRFLAEGIRIIRIGLQLEDASKVRGGAWHPSLGMAVMGAAYGMGIEALRYVLGEPIEVSVSPSEYSIAVGFGRANLLLWEKENGKIKVKQDTSLKPGQLKVMVEGSEPMLLCWRDVFRLTKKVFEEGSGWRFSRYLRNPILRRLLERLPQ